MAIKSDPDDYWGQAISLLTGYNVPSRKTLFDKLKSNDDIPLMWLWIEANAVRSVTVDDYSVLSGWHTDVGRSDYRLAYYAWHKDDEDPTLYTANIRFIGAVPDENGEASFLNAGQIMMAGSAFSSGSTQWDSTNMSAYISGAKLALDRLITDHSTKGFGWGGTNVGDAEAVDLKSFERSAQSFDRSVKFFIDHATVLEQWEKSLGSEQAAWKGKAAGVFWNLIHTLNSNYASYVDQLGGADYHATNTTVDQYTPKSKYSDAIAEAQRQLFDSAVKLQNAWDAWAGSREHDPYRALLEELDELSNWILQHNVPNITVYDHDSGDPTYSPKPGFSDNPGYGALDDISTFKVVGQKAVDRWNRNVDQFLLPAAKIVLSNLGNNWSTAAADFEDPIKTKHTDTLSEDHAKDQGDPDGSDIKDAFDQIGDNFKHITTDLNDLGDNFGDLGNNTHNALNSLGNSTNDALNGLGTNLNSLGNSTNDALNDMGTNLNSLGNSTNDALNDMGGSLQGGAPGGTSLGDLNSLTAGDPDLIGSGGPSSSTGDLNTGLLGGGAGLVGGALPVGGPLFGPPTSLNGNIPRGAPSNGTSLDDDGNLVHVSPDGSQTSFNPATGDLTVTDPSGETTVTHLAPGDTVTNPDGSETQLNPDGTLTTTFPDGSSQQFDPSDGSLNTTLPDGSSTTTNLNDPFQSGGLPNPGANLPGIGTGLTGGLAGGSHGLNTGLPGGGSSLGNLGGSGLGGGLGGSSNHELNPGLPGGLNPAGPADLGDGFMDYDSSPYTGGALGGPGAGAGDLLPSTPSGGPGGMPLNPAGLGGGGAGGAGAGSSNGERTRAVLTEPGGSLDRRPSSRAAALDGEDLPFRRGGQATSSPGMPMGGAPMGGGPGAGQSTESSERERGSWVTEEEDVWGTDENGTPAVIG